MEYRTELFGLEENILKHICFDSDEISYLVKE